jgi:hypothetical protein
MECEEDLDDPGVYYCVSCWNTYEEEEEEEEEQEEVAVEKEAPAPSPPAARKPPQTLADYMSSKPPAPPRPPSPAPPPAQGPDEEVCAVFSCTGGRAPGCGGYCSTHYQIHMLNLDAPEQRRKNSGLDGHCVAKGCRENIHKVTRTPHCNSLSLSLFY